MSIHGSTFVERFIPTHSLTEKYNCHFADNNNDHDDDDDDDEYDDDDDDDDDDKS